MAKYYARVSYYVGGYGEEDAGYMTAISLPSLRSSIYFKLTHPMKYFPGKDPNRLSFYIDGDYPGEIVYKKGTVLWIDREGYYHKVNTDGTIGQKLKSAVWYD